MRGLNNSYQFAFDSIGWGSVVKNWNFNCHIFAVVIDLNE
jgi:hypothetical protein